MKIATLNFFEQTFFLHPFKAIYWKEKSILLIADLHLGKAQHFRKNGLPVPPGVQHENWDRLYSLLIDFKPERVIFLGDLFHSYLNTEYEDLVMLVRQFPHTTFELVRGNHDILEESSYKDLQMIIHDPELAIPPFNFSHFPKADSELPPLYNLSGHVHPSIKLFGNGKQSIRLPCFYFGKQQGILPAFGSFTGTSGINPVKGDRVFVIVENQVMEVE